MDGDTAAREQGTAVPARYQVERRRKTVVCLSCPSCASAVPVLARCVDGDVEPVLECRTCGWQRQARRTDDRH